MKTFAHQRPIRDKATGEIVGQKDSPAMRVTVEPLGGHFGKDKRKRLVVSMKRGDIIEAWPYRSTRKLSCTAADFYMWLVKCKANKAQLETARARKLKKQAARARQQIARADAKLRNELRRERGAE